MATTKTATKAKTNGAKVIEHQMTFERDTKGTYVYKAEGDVAVKGLYVTRSHMPDGPPPQITIKIS